MSATRPGQPACLSHRIAAGLPMCKRLLKSQLAAGVLIIGSSLGPWGPSQAVASMNPQLDNPQSTWGAPSSRPQAYSVVVSLADASEPKIELSNEGRAVGQNRGGAMQPPSPQCNCQQSIPAIDSTVLKPGLPQGPPPIAEPPAQPPNQALEFSSKTYAPAQPPQTAQPQPPKAEAFPPQPGPPANGKVAVEKVPDVSLPSTSVSPPPGSGNGGDGGRPDTLQQALKGVQVPDDDVSNLSKVDFTRILETARDKLLGKQRGKISRYLELDEIRSELAEKEYQLLQKETELREKEQNIAVLQEELDIERKLRALVTKEKEQAAEQARLAMGLCFGTMVP